MTTDAEALRAENARLIQEHDRMVRDYNDMGRVRDIAWAEAERLRKVDEAAAEVLRVFWSTGIALPQLTEALGKLREARHGDR